MELVTAFVWWLAACAIPEGELLLFAVHLLVLSALLTAAFVDLDCFEIPDSVSIGGMVLAPLAAGPDETIAVLKTFAPALQP